MSQLAPLWGPFIGALVSYVISIAACSVPVAFILKKLESRYRPLDPEDDNKVIDDSTADDSEFDTQSPQIELTDADDDKNIEYRKDDILEPLSKTAPDPGHI